MAEALYKHIPDGWTKPPSTDPKRIPLPQNEAEYNEIVELVAHSEKRVKKIERLEDPIKYVLFLVRQQHLCSMEPDKSYYKTRRFLTLFERDVAEAIAVHLDKRRMSALNRRDFKSKCECCDGEAVLVVAVVTDNLLDTFKPLRDSDYYVEYVVYFEPMEKQHEPFKLLFGRPMEERQKPLLLAIEDGEEKQQEPHLLAIEECMETQQAPILLPIEDGMKKQQESLFPSIEDGLKMQQESLLLANEKRMETQQAPFLLPIEDGIEKQQEPLLLPIEDVAEKQESLLLPIAEPVEKQQQEPLLLLTEERMEMQQAPLLLPVKECKEKQQESLLPSIENCMDDKIGKDDKIGMEKQQKSPLHPTEDCMEKQQEPLSLLNEERMKNEQEQIQED